MKVYVLFHSYSYTNKVADTVLSEVKLLGIYSSSESAMEAQSRYLKRDGFNQYPASCFLIKDFSVDADSDFKTGLFSWKE